MMLGQKPRRARPEKKPVKNKVLRFPAAKRRRRKGSGNSDGAGPRWLPPLLIVLAVLLIGTGVSLDDLPWLDGPSATQSGTGTMSDDGDATWRHAGPGDTLSADFGLCEGQGRISCVVDGDTFWLEGDKIRILDINTPEISSPQCDAELRLGERATERLQELLNAGPFSLEPGPERTDRYGRKLMRVTRGGINLGEVLIEEGLAERWRGYRGGWC